ncbi:MAG: NAD(P)-binding domain-containing protein [Cyanobacteria bacterium P01_H01_bin.15]
MAVRLLDADFSLIAYNRTPEKSTPLIAVGATSTTDLTDVIAKSDCLILMLGDAAAIEVVLLTPENHRQLAGRIALTNGDDRPR